MIRTIGHRRVSLLTVSTAARATTIHILDDAVDLITAAASSLRPGRPVLVRNGNRGMRRRRLAQKT